MLEGIKLIQFTNKAFYIISAFDIFFGANGVTEHVEFQARQLLKASNAVGLDFGQKIRVHFFRLEKNMNNLRVRFVHR